uniref:Transposase n=1 Tax=Peronospora matthiolae TaxID=2874970 RepID=A0AAV1UTL5_9STRA
METDEHVKTIRRDGRKGRASFPFATSFLLSLLLGNIGGSRILRRHRLQPGKTGRLVSSHRHDRVAVLWTGVTKYLVQWPGHVEILANVTCTWTCYGARLWGAADERELAMITSCSV